MRETIAKDWQDLAALSDTDVAALRQGEVATEEASLPARLIHQDLFDLPAVSGLALENGVDIIAAVQS